MKTTHQFAQELLELDECPVLVDLGAGTHFVTPAICQETMRDTDGMEHTVFVIEAEIFYLVSASNSNADPEAE